MAQSVYGEAVGYFEQTLSALQHLPKQHDIYEQAILTAATGLFTPCR